MDVTHKQSLRDAAARRGDKFCEECGSKLTKAGCPECGQEIKMAKKLSRKSKKDVDTINAAVVESTQESTSTSEGAKKMATITVSRKGTNKKGTRSIYAFPWGTQQLAANRFTGGVAPESFEVQVQDGVFAEKQARAKLSPEERKAQRANAPKPTLAEKIAKREAALAKLKAKLEAGGTPSQQAATEAAAGVSM